MPKILVKIYTNNFCAKIFIMSKNLTTRAEDYSKWYNELVVKADLAENSGVRGCMVIKPYGYAIWEKMQAQLDKMFKETGHSNAYFPLFVPKSMFEAEEKNAEGFAKECAIVTHYRLKNDETRPGKLMVDPNAKLEEELIVRPTSEAIIWSTYKGWVQSYRDLPLLINQWANVVRWEMRTRLFLRTAEFLWQEGHTAHATRQEAIEESEKMMNVYADFVENFMAIPVVKGLKTETERFAGADETYCIEALMQDGKALQAGTSHFLGQNFAKAFDVKFANKEGKLDHVWATSWGVSTRLIGALIMAHSDDNGLVLPPKIAPEHVVILPVIHKEEDRANILAYCETLAAELRKQSYAGRRVYVEVDTRPLTGGEKGWSWVKRGAPIRLEIGGKECAQETVFMGRRDKEYKERVSMPRADFIANLSHIFDEMQQGMLERAKKRLADNTKIIESEAEFNAHFAQENPGFVLAHWNGDEAIEDKIKGLQVTIRCIPFGDQGGEGKCIFTGEPSKQRVIFAKSY